MPFHPEIASRLALLDGVPSLEEALSNPEMLRQLEAFDAYPDAALPPNVVTEDRSIDGPHGPIRVRIYSPAETAHGLRNGFVWMHGGGFRFGDLDMKEADWTARELAHRASAVVVSVDYRLAVDGVTYPVPLDDVVAAVRWVRKNAGDLGLASIAVGGASAGANLATGAALRLRDEESWAPEHIVLVYPSMHGDFPRPSDSLARAQAEMMPAMRMSPAMYRYSKENYLGNLHSNPPGYGIPALADLDGLPPTLVLNAEYDDVRASGEAFSAALAGAGVDVEQVLVRGVLHGFLNLSASFEPVDDALERIARRLRATSQIS
ncbi:alpha/beta hydrolase [Burkholderia sp. RS01]|uniref:alpha/beta hydrolase n=1 Tax=unclassified Burkholderia TaxID=2613784 RepID=UPI0032188988